MKRHHTGAIQRATHKIVMRPGAPKAPEQSLDHPIPHPVSPLGHATYDGNDEGPLNVHVHLYQPSGNALDQGGSLDDDDDED